VSSDPTRPPYVTSKVVNVAGPLELGLPRLEVIRASAATYYKIPAYGYLEYLELRPQSNGPNGTLPNMDAGASVRLFAELEYGGVPVAMDLIVHSRSIA
jgi:hypothetical protein